jgi:hypothetical protein
MVAAEYPWFGSVVGDGLEQGDILEACPVFRPPEDIAGSESLSAFFEAEARDVVVVSQSCDLIKGREKLSEVLMMCPIWRLSQFRDGHHLSTAKGREQARRGDLPGVHLLAACVLPGMEREVRAVDFRQVFSLPLAFARKQANVADQRLRLLPPYREHLARRSPVSSCGSGCQRTFRRFGKRTHYA